MSVTGAPKKIKEEKTRAMSLSGPHRLSTTAEVLPITRNTANWD